MAQKINKAYSILGIIKRNWIHMDESSFIVLYTQSFRKKHPLILLAVSSGIVV